MIGSKTIYVQDFLHSIGKSLSGVLVIETDQSGAGEEVGFGLDLNSKDLGEY